MKLDFKDLYAEITGSSVMKKARQYIAEDRVGNIVCEKIGNSYSVNAEVYGGEDYYVDITFNKNGKLEDYYCECPASENYKGPCKHIIAVALLYEKNIQENPELKDLKEDGLINMVETAKNKAAVDQLLGNSAADALIGAYVRRKISKCNVVPDQLIHLKPSVTIGSGNNLLVSFRIGTERMYVLKNLYEFSARVRRNEDYRYGDRLEFVHNMENFEPASREMVRFILRKTDEVTGMMSGNLDAANLCLVKDGIDQFFTFYEGMELDAKNIGAVSTKASFFVNVVRENPSFKLEIVELADGNYNVRLDKNNKFILLEGEKSLYVLTKDYVYICDEDYSDRMRLLLQAFSSRVEITFNGEQLKSFCANVYGEIEGLVQTQSDVDLTELRPPEFNAKLYLDLDDVNNISGTLVCRYGDLETDIFRSNPAEDAAVRDIVAEYTLKKMLLKYFDRLKSGKLSISREYMIYEFLTQGVDELNRCCEIFVTDKFKGMQVKKPNKLNVGVKVSNNLIDLQFDFGGYTVSQLSEILSAYRLKKKYTRLKDGSFIELENSSIAAVNEIFESLDLDLNSDNSEIQLGMYRVPYLNEILKNNGDINVERDVKFRDMVKNMKNAADADYEVPKGLSHILRNYQKTGYRWLRTLCDYQFGGILADDMGLGKSLEIIALLKSYRGQGQSIVVSPTSLVLNWKNEFKKFAPELKVLPVIGSAEERKNLIENAGGYEILVTSYELLRRDVELYENKEFLFAVIDEAQYIKNHFTKSSHSVKQLKSRYRFALTGTPIENSLAELWSIFDFVMPGYLYPYGKFKNNFERKIVLENDPYTVNRLKQMVKPFILRRLKSNVLSELPEKVESVLSAGLEEQQRELYMANLMSLKETVKNMPEQEFRTNKIQVLALLTRLRQICCSPSLAVENYQGNDAKLEMLMELIENGRDSGHKMLVFSQFTSMLGIIGEELKKREMSYYLLEGDTPKQDRMQMVERFNKDKVPVFLISLKAGGTGLNLTGADVVIHYDPWWNMSVQNQATDRAYRMGQKNSVQVYKLILEDTVEEKIVELQEKKSELSELVIQEGEHFVSKLDKDELLKLMEME